MWGQNYVARKTQSCIHGLTVGTWIQEYGKEHELIKLESPYAPFSSQSHPVLFPQSIVISEITLSIYLLIFSFPYPL